MDLKEIWYDGMNHIHLAQNIVQWEHSSVTLHFIQSREFLDLLSDY